MEKITHQEKVQKPKKTIPSELLKKSRQTAVLFKKQYPSAEIYPFNPITKKCEKSWSKEPGVNPETYMKGRHFLWGLKLSSVPLCVLDFDIKSPEHPEGMSPATFQNLIKEFELNDYPFFTEGKSGNGGHFWFSDKNAPATEADMDFIQGIDYKVCSIIFLIHPLPFFLSDDMRDVPEQYLKRKKSFRGKPKRGRFHTQQKTTYQAMLNGDAPAVFEAYHVAREKGQTKTEAFSVAGPSLNKMEHMPFPDQNLIPSKPVANTSDHNVQFVTEPEQQPPPKWLLPDFIPFGCFSVWAGPTGKGRTTTLLNLLTMNARGVKLPGTDQVGDRRPFLYHGPENALAIIQKRVKDAGGDLKKDIHFLKMTNEDGKKLPSMIIPNNMLLNLYIKAILSKVYSAIVSDTLYLLLKDQNQKAGEVFQPIFTACQESGSAFVGVGHLKKQIQDQEVIHHIRGDSDIVTYARSVVYMREGKEKNQRVIVPLKNSLTGNVDTGFVTKMRDNDSPIEFEHHTNSNFDILKEYGKPFSSFTDAPKDSAEENLISDIKTVFLGHESPGWPLEDFKKWLNHRTGRPCSDTSRKRLLKRADLCSRQKGVKWFVQKRI